MNLKSILKSGIVAGALTAMPLAAGAATFTLATANNYFGGNGSEGVRISDSTLPLTEGALAGGFAMTGDIGKGPTSFTAWCLDIVTYMKKSSGYEITTTPFQADFTSTQMINIEKLFETAFSGLTINSGGNPLLTAQANANSAGFQLALWELVYETGSSFNVGTGTFTATGGAAVGVANDLLAGLGGAITQKYKLTWLESNDPNGGHISQNLVTVAAVPLPAAGLLLAGALAGLAALRRRAARAA